VDYIRQQVIANLVTVDSEQRLGQTLLQLARTLGKKDPRSIRIEPELPDLETLKEKTCGS
jgi:CRP/FNR family transcriptional regulator, cyclic AMP receptor protein